MSIYRAMSESEEEYEIEKIIGSRFTEVGRKEYSVKWVGYAEPTWEEAGQFDKDHKNLVEAYRLANPSHCLKIQNRNSINESKL